MNLTVADILECTGGFLARGNGDTPVDRLCTDTRILRADDVYVALRGKHYDGEEFVLEALEKGAAGVVCSREFSLCNAPNDAFVVTVLDTTTALGDIARHWRQKVDPTVLAISGSSGKTTTKEMLAHVCRGEMNVLATEGNKNNHIGLPLTLARLREDHEVAIVEMGMNHSGELTQLAQIAQPDIALLTNVGDAHLGNFESMDHLLAAKAELIESLPEGATAILNADCPQCARVRSEFSVPSTVLTYGVHMKADVQARNIQQGHPFGYQFTLRVSDESVPVFLPVFGRYQVQNALAAAAAAAALGVSPQTIAERLTTFQAPEMRSQIRRFGGLRVVVDCYNASPSATIEAVRSFAEMMDDCRRILVLGDMLELGQFSERMHRRVGDAVADTKPALTICVGEQARWIADEAHHAEANVCIAASVDEAVEILSVYMESGDAILVKGSRATRLERLVDLLQTRMTEEINEETTI
ncbi:UDP-N-acetylmuramoyl-tripeptide--D-alanyl-D-alanine ligase [bacterium]|nr:UDP-N-acetylmuramoyl-tripeptide--D-alanyl-D-alanine ligase [bacterium]